MLQGSKKPGSRRKGCSIPSWNASSKSIFGPMQQARATNLTARVLVGSAVIATPRQPTRYNQARRFDGHDLFFSVRDESDSRTVIDFIQKRRRLSLGNIRKELRPLVGGAASTLPPYSALPMTSKDRLSVENEFRNPQDAERHAYLESEPAFLRTFCRTGSPAAFEPTREATRSFPHFDQGGLCRVLEEEHRLGRLARAGPKTVAEPCPGRR